MLLEMNVNGVHPSTRTVHQGPDFSRVLFCSKPIYIAIGKFAVDLPLPISPLEFKSSPDRIAEVDGRQIIEARSCRILAIIGNGRKHNIKTQYRIALTSGQNITGRATSIVLFETVLKKDRLAGFEL